ncbi:pseudouridine synthase [Neptuniibacter halophilus]|uniref:pseudouridine synthase n=1 Tax=Neptuniibacter halophilus TaxID=651666 RepID=UPI002573E9A0|nr:RNA pseudouridine synthase [Neptuniibacter halophilus]
MPSHKSRLDRFISQHSPFSRSEVRLLIAQGRIRVNDQPADKISQVIGQFCRVQLDDQLLQDNQPIYLMLNKPLNTVSATRDDKHRTVLDLLPAEFAHLHIAGRLDLNSTGLLLLTNDGGWSSGITAAGKKVSKQYQVRVANPITAEYAAAFAAGFYFPFEDIKTQPALLHQTGEYEAEITLTEGRYHQIKRMFGRFRNPVTRIHRTAIGALQLDPALKPGESRLLTADEINCLR